MKKPLLIILACLLCFFAGYFAGSKPRPVNKRFNTPFKMRTIPKRPMPYKRIPTNIQKINNISGKTNTAKPVIKNKTNVQPKTVIAQNKK